MDDTYIHTYIYTAIRYIIQKNKRNTNFLCYSTRDFWILWIPEKYLKYAYIFINVTVVKESCTIIWCFPYRSNDASFDSLCFPQV